MTKYLNIHGIRTELTHDDIEKNLHKTPYLMFSIMLSDRQMQTELFDFLHEFKIFNVQDDFMNDSYVGWNLLISFNQPVKGTCSWDDFRLFTISTANHNNQYIEKETQNDNAVKYFYDLNSLKKEILVNSGIGATKIMYQSRKIEKTV